MKGLEEELLSAIQHLLSLRGQCLSNVNSLHKVADLSVKQLYYLKLIDENDSLTFSELAKKTKISKPSVSELINKLIDCECVYKEKCPNDKRVSYIYLTEKGTNIARYEKTAALNLISRICNSLTNDEINTLMKLINKVK